MHDLTIYDNWLPASRQGEVVHSGTLEQIRKYAFDHAFELDGPTKEEYLRSFHPWPGPFSGEAGLPPFPRMAQFQIDDINGHKLVIVPFLQGVSETASWDRPDGVVEMRHTWDPLLLGVVGKWLYPRFGGYYLKQLSYYLRLGNVAADDIVAHLLTAIRANRWKLSGDPSISEGSSRSVWWVTIGVTTARDRSVSIELNPVGGSVGLRCWGPSKTLEAQKDSVMGRLLSAAMPGWDGGSG